MLPSLPRDRAGGEPARSGLLPAAESDQSYSTDAEGEQPRRRRFGNRTSSPGLAGGQDGAQGEHDNSHDCVSVTSCPEAGTKEPCRSLTPRRLLPAAEPDQRHTPDANSQQPWPDLASGRNQTNRLYRRKNPATKAAALHDAFKQLTVNWLLGARLDR